MGLVLALMLTAALPRADGFDAQATIQGLYDEISQTLLQVATDSDLDQLHDVLYAPDWVFVDASGKQHPWSDAREELLHMIQAEHLTAMFQRIQKFALTAQGATAVVQAQTMYPAADDPAQSAAQSSRIVTDTTTYRDTWVQMGGAWRLQSRTQVGASVRRP